MDADTQNLFYQVQKSPKYYTFKKVYYNKWSTFVRFQWVFFSLRKFLLFSEFCSRPFNTQDVISTARWLDRDFAKYAAIEPPQSQEDNLQKMDNIIFTFVIRPSTVNMTLCLYSALVKHTFRLKWFILVSNLISLKRNSIQYCINL